MRITWSLKQITLAALTCTLIGIAGLLYLYKQGAIDQNYVPVDMEKVLDGGSIQSFSLSTDIADATFVSSPTNDLRIRLSGEINEADVARTGIVVEENSKTDVSVTIRAKDPIQIGIDVTRLFNVFNKRAKLTVELPDKIYKSLKVKTETGDLAMPAVRAETLQLQSDTGEITLAGFTGTDLTVSSNTGTMRLEHISSTLDLRSDTGHIVADLDALPGGASLATDTGDIQLTMKAPLPADFDFASDTGRTSATGADDRTLNLTVDEKHKLKGSISGGGPLIKARSDTGDIELSVR